MAQHPVDVHVGRRLRSRRIILGMSQENLGDSVDLTFQQIQKYEKGLNRIGSSRLFEFSRTLKVPISYFFEDFDDGDARIPNDVAETGMTFENDNMAHKEVFTLVRAFCSIENEIIRKRIQALIKSIGRTQIIED